MVSTPNIEMIGLRSPWQKNVGSWAPLWHPETWHSTLQVHQECLKGKVPIYGGFKAKI